jgi:hypothetical protein
MCERERRPLCDLWCFQFGCRIVLYPLALLGEPEEGPQSFQFLGTGKRAILPLLTETPQSDQIKLHKKPQTTSGRKVLHTFGEHLVFADCGNVEVAGLHVRQKILPRLIDRYGWIGLFSFCIVLPLSFPPPHNVLGLLPITRAYRLSDFLTTQCAVHPNHSTAPPIAPAFGAVLAGYLVPPVNCSLELRKIHT